MFKINAIATTTVRKGKTLQLTATEPVESWVTSNPSAVAVDGNTGLITGMRAGSMARITATSEAGETYTIIVTVES